LKNQYPVLFLTLKGVKALSFEDAYEKLQVKLAGLCKTYERLLESDKIDIDDRKVFLDLKAQQASYANVADSLKTIMRMMAAGMWRSN
jgi:hypothetical protein